MARRDDEQLQPRESVPGEEAAVAVIPVNFTVFFKAFLKIFMLLKIFLNIAWYIKLLFIDEFMI